ncbi:hypothetical protein [Burkholderia lata]|uniref:Uncharacterized protein n=1 Tax=Burkholderia lata (strain ATCC 17760 / DSM 23089 / LMG 22485 / NCIMB 9086 / R18194 / 383) TaxID=482957 RepID=Q398G4_BURL3|nr:hypothetical protein [Burkholderia lata]ABB11147.1 hypothetical protein Bcep18194_B1033 [Burkholderia lata]
MTEEILDAFELSGITFHEAYTPALKTRLKFADGNVNANRLISAVRCILAGQPEPRAEVTAVNREGRHWNPVYNTDPVQRACTELPDGWGVNACMERDAGWVEVYGPNGEEPNFESDADHFDWRIHEAIDFAIDAARAGGV